MESKFSFKNKIKLSFTVAKNILAVTQMHNGCKIVFLIMQPNLSKVSTRSFTEQ